MDLTKIEISISTMLYEKIKTSAESKGYNKVEDFILDLIRYEVFVSKGKNDCEKPSKEEFKILSENEDLDDEEFTYFSQRIERELDDRGFNQDNSNS